MFRPAKHLLLSIGQKYALVFASPTRFVVCVKGHKPCLYWLPRLLTFTRFTVVLAQDIQSTVLHPDKALSPSEALKSELFLSAAGAGDKTALRLRSFNP